MSVILDHTIVWVRDKTIAAHYLADLLELHVGPRSGLFLPVRTNNGVTLDYADTDPDAAVVQLHYAFGVNDDLFDRVLTRLDAAGQTYWADPFHAQPGQINTTNGGRGLYFLDPNGHNMEIQTVPDGTYGQ